MSDAAQIRIERQIAAPVQTVWELWTTPAGIEKWWAPDGFRTDVHTLELRPGGELVYAMTATAPEQIAFMEQAGMPTTTVSRKTFTEVDAPHRLAYQSLIDFVPGRPSYEHLTVVELSGAGEATAVTMTIEPMHDAEWTDRLVAGRTNELDNLQELVARRG
jgi:uncharacterized protein YndB with AHSA1/START domain